MQQRKGVSAQQLRLMREAFEELDISEVGYITGGECEYVFQALHLQPEMPQLLDLMRYSIVMPNEDDEPPSADALHVDFADFLNMMMSKTLCEFKNHTETYLSCDNEVKKQSLKGPMASPLAAGVPTNRSPG